MAEGDPIFVLGSPRSGTTLLRLALSAHPGIVVAPESSFFTWLHPEFGDWSVADVDTDRTPRFAEAVTSARKFETWGIDSASIAATIAADRPTSYAELAAIPYRLYRDSVGKPSARWGDKNNVHLELVPLIRSIYPTAAFVHIVRDVRDTWLSARDIDRSASDAQYIPRLEGDAEVFARTWARDNAAVADLLNGDPHYSQFRYEDLVADPRATLAPVFGALGLDWDDAVLDFPTSPVSEPDATMGWKALTREPITDSRAGRWRDALDPETARILTNSAHDTLKRFGYPT